MAARRGAGDSREVDFRNAGFKKCAARRPADIGRSRACRTAGPRSGDSARAVVEGRRPGAGHPRVPGGAREAPGDRGQSSARCATAGFVACAVRAAPDPGRRRRVLHRRGQRVPSPGHLGRPCEERRAGRQGIRQEARDRAGVPRDVCVARGGGRAGGLDGGVRAEGIGDARASHRAGARGAAAHLRRERG